MNDVISGLIEFATFFATVGGLALVQFVFNRRFEKRLAETSVNSSQFELFQKMNDYLENQFTRFTERSETSSQSIDTLIKEFDRMRDEHKEFRDEFQGLHKELIRLQILQLLDHDKSNVHAIVALHKRYKSEFKGNSYIDPLVESYYRKYQDK